MKYRSNSLLAFTPKNSFGENVMQHAMYFHKEFNMRIFALDILEKSSFLANKLQSKQVELDKNQAKEKLLGFLEKTVQEKLPANVIPRIQSGDLFSTLISESKKGGYDFIIVDKSESILKKPKLNKFISKSSCPVLVTSIDFPAKKIKKIVIPIDITQSTKKRLLWATYFAQKLNAHIQIVSAININIDETKSLAFKNAEKIKQMLSERDVKCDFKMLKTQNQPTYKVILEYIENENPELVIIRTHQESLLAVTRIGQLVSEIVHNCKMPVFTVG